MNIEVKRSKRKSISIYIKDANVEVRAPYLVPLKDIETFVFSKLDWIKSNLKKQKENKLKEKNLEVAPSKQIEILGNVYTFQIHNISKYKIFNDLILIPENYNKEDFLLFIRKFAKKYLKNRVQELADFYGFNYKSISIKDTKTRWGSCSSKNNLNFSYKLMFCNSDVVDYVIIHELSHTKQKNHSKKFWDLVSNCCPDYKSKKLYLKQHNYYVLW